MTTTTTTHKPNPCPMCGEDRNHPSQRGDHARLDDGSRARSGCHSYPNGTPNVAAVENAPPPPPAGWDIVVQVVSPGSTFLVQPHIPGDVIRAVYEAVWAEQDGYGVRGFTPAQGWDWSGIRDSSDVAVLRMACAALKLLNKHGISLEG